MSNLSQFFGGVGGLGGGLTPMFWDYGSVSTSFVVPLEGVLYVSLFGGGGGGAGRTEATQASKDGSDGGDSVIFINDSPTIIAEGGKGGFYGSTPPHRDSAKIVGLPYDFIEVDFRKKEVFTGIRDADYLMSKMWGAGGAARMMKYTGSAASVPGGDGGGIPKRGVQGGKGGALFINHPLKVYEGDVVRVEVGAGGDSRAFKGNTGGFIFIYYGG